MLANDKGETRVETVKHPNPYSPVVAVEFTKADLERLDHLAWIDDYVTAGKRTYVKSQAMLGLKRLADVEARANKDLLQQELEAAEWRVEAAGQYLNDANKVFSEAASAYRAALKNHEWLKKQVAS